MQKVIAYVTHGDDLLVFEQREFPDAGTQVLGGTLENRELPAVGVNLHLGDRHAETWDQLLDVGV